MCTSAVSGSQIRFAHHVAPAARLPADLLLSGGGRAHGVPRDHRLHHPLAVQGHRELLAPADPGAHGALRGVELRAAQAGLARHPRLLRLRLAQHGRMVRGGRAAPCARARPPAARGRPAQHAPGAGSRSAARSLRIRVRPVLLFETGLVTRYYLPPEPTCGKTCCARVRPTPSAPTRAAPATTTWSSTERGTRTSPGSTLRPLPSIPAVAGHFAFWNEREDTTIFVDGEPLERLGVRESGDGGELLPSSREYWGEPSPDRDEGPRPGRTAASRRAPQPPGGRPAGRRSWTWTSNGPADVPTSGWSRAEAAADS